KSFLIFFCLKMQILCLQLFCFQNFYNKQQNAIIELSSNIKTQLFLFCKFYVAIKKLNIFSVIKNPNNFKILKGNTLWVSFAVQRNAKILNGIFSLSSSCT